MLGRVLDPEEPEPKPHPRRGGRNPLACLFPRTKTATPNWVAVKEVSLSYYIRATLLFIHTYIHSLW